jgi:hypothetical protein
MAHTIEKDSLALNIIANAIVTHPHSPLTNSDIGQLAALTGVLLKRL